MDGMIMIIGVGLGVCFELMLDLFIPLAAAYEV